MWPDSGESRGGKVARGRYPRVRGRGEEREFIRVPPFVPSPGADKEAASGGRFLPLTPSSSLSPLPSPPPPSPRISRPAGNLGGEPGRLSPQPIATLPRPSPPTTSPETFPGRCLSWSPPHPPRCLTRSSLRGERGRNLQNHCFREMHLFVCTFPANQCEQSTLASSFCQFFLIPRDKIRRARGQPQKIKALTQLEVGCTLGSPSWFLPSDHPLHPTHQNNSKGHQEVLENSPPPTPTPTHSVPWELPLIRRTKPSSGSHRDLHP